MTLQQLRVLVAVVEQRSFTRGGQAVFMTQSAASQHVRSLEQALGMPLVERIGSEVVPTRAGEGLVSYAREMLRVAADAERFVTSLRQGRAGRLVLGASGSAVYLVPALVSGFRASHPDVEIVLQVLPRQSLREAVSGGAVDVALMSGPVRHAGLAVQALCPDRIVLAVPPASPLLPAAALAPHPLARIAEQSIMALGETAPSWQLIDRWAASHGIELQPAARLDNADAIKKAVEAGLGVAFLSAWVVEREVALGTLRVISVDPPPPVRPYELVRRAARRVDEPLETFLRFAPEYLRRRLPSHVVERLTDQAFDGAPAGFRPLPTAAQVA
ncbi:MAG: LysR family transcriptional regulator [Chloroflexota bacterium]